MNFPGLFTESILPEKMDSMAVSFVVESLLRQRGGTAGNIAYNLALLGEKVAIASAAGSDFGAYQAHLEAAGIDCKAIKVVDDNLTASCFITTDRANNQLVAFYPGAIEATRAVRLADLNLAPDDLVIIAPTDAVAMETHVRECRALELRYIFDPGKQSPQIPCAQLLDGIEGCALLVSNEYEFALMAKCAGMSERDLIQRVPICVVTNAKAGARVYQGGDPSPSHIRAVSLSTVVDPTGAGDAFLAGFAHGFARQLSPIECAQLGTVMASFSLGAQGGQSHTFARDAFDSRFHATFGVPNPVRYGRDANGKATTLRT